MPAQFQLWGNGGKPDWSRRVRSPLIRYGTAVAMSALGELARIPILSEAFSPLIVYAPFVVASALLGGLGPGLLTTLLCTLEADYFAIGHGSLGTADRADWYRLATFVVTGVVSSVLSEWLRRTNRRLTENQRKTTAILESISDGFNTFDREWRYTYVNAAAARMVGKSPHELLGKSIWELWPHAGDSPFGATFRKAVSENVPLTVEAFYPEPLNAWFEVRCYPSKDGLAVFFKNTTERRLTEERLRLMESAILQTRDGVLILRITGEGTCRPEPVFVNAAFERMTGFSLADLESGSLSQLYGARLDPHLIERPNPGCPVGCPDLLELKVNRKDGSEFWAEFDFRPLADSSGEYSHCVWTCRDTTGRKQAFDSARFLSSIVEYSDDAILSKDLNGVVLSWNQGAERIYGYSASEMVGQSVGRLIAPERGGELEEIMGYLQVGQRIEHMETERIRKDGRRIFVSVTYSPLRDAGGKVSAVSVIARDITERKRAEEALALSEQRYRSLAMATTQVVWSTDAQGEVQDIPMWREFTGQSPEEVRGWGWLNAIHPDDREQTGHRWSTAVRTRNVYTTDYRLRRRDGEYRWMAVHGVPVLEGEGRIREWVGSCADITDRVHAEEEVLQLNERLERRVVERTAELETANRELEAFAYSVSHDLRAPLRAVDGFSRILLEEHAPQLSPEAQRYLEIVRKNAVQMGELIDDLLRFSRLTRQPLNKAVVDMAELSWHVIEELYSEWHGRQIDVEVGELPRCEADPRLLRQVLTNLLSNAVKYTRGRERAKIEVGASSSRRDGAYYFVRDNGAGFDMRYADKLFGVFQRLHAAEEYEGTGVGLAIVHRIVTRHGGRVWAEAAVDQGATFYFTLPGGGRAPLADGATPQPVAAQGE